MTAADDTSGARSLRAAKWRRTGVVAIFAGAMVLGLPPAAMSEPTKPPPAPPTAAPSPSPSASSKTAAAADNLVDVQLETGCVQDGPASVRVWADLDRFDGQQLEWVLRGPAGGITSGQVGWMADEGYEPLDFELTPGHYRVTITLVDRKVVVADKQFDVMRCVTVSTSCHTATFTNPAGNPAARVKFDGGEYLDEHQEETGKGGALTVKPGRSVAVETFHEEIAWSAYGPGVDSTNDAPNAGEHYSELIEQHCGPTRTRGVISCASGRRGSVNAWLHPPNNRRLSYRIDTWNQPIRDGRLGRNRHVRLKLRVGSYYTFRSYSSAAALPYDRAESLRVVRCVTAGRRGNAVRFHNPSGPRVRIAYRISGGPKKVIRLKRGKSATIRVGAGALRWHTNALRPVSRWRIDRGRGVVRIHKS